jgi:hypothetical protein
MQMNRRNQFVVHYPKGTPLVWQPYQACSYNTTGSITLDRRELTPDPIYMKERFCHDSLMDSCFEHFINYDANGDISLSPEGVRMFNMLIEELMANAQLGFRISAVSGQMFDVDSVNFSMDNTANIEDLFKRVHPTLKGVLKIAYDQAQIDAPWMDLDVAADTDFDEMGEFTGNPVDAVEAIAAKAPKPLRQLYKRGGTVTGNRFNFLPIIVCSDGWYSAFLRRYNEEGAQVALNRVRLSKRTFGAENSPTPTEVMYLDGRVPIVPLSEITGFDQYVEGNLNFLGIVASGNMQVGSSFTGLPNDIEGRDIGVMIGRDNDMHSDSYGSYTVLSHVLAKTAIADKNYFAGCINHTVPA